MSSQNERNNSVRLNDSFSGIASMAPRQSLNGNSLAGLSAMRPQNPQQAQQQSQAVQQKPKVK